MSCSQNWGWDLVRWKRSGGEILSSPWHTCSPSFYIWISLLYLPMLKSNSWVQEACMESSYTSKSSELGCMPLHPAHFLLPSNVLWELIWASQLTLFCWGGPYSIYGQTTLFFVEFRVHTLMFVGPALLLPIYLFLFHHRFYFLM